MGKLRYSEFADRIDIDKLEAAIGFDVMRHERGNDIGYCLWPANHTNGDTTGKFAIHRENKVYNCWACGGGSLLSLAMELYDFDVDEATDWLYQFTQDVDTRTDDEFTDYMLALIEDVKVRVDTMPYFNPRVLERYTGPVDYFRTRGISDDVIGRYHLCYSELAMKPAPVKQGRDGQPTKIDDDYYGPVAIFPHYWQGTLVGWQHRWMDWDEERTKVPRWLAKYTNTTDFPKATTLFGYDAALKAEQPVVVCESTPTVLFLQSQGYPAVAYFGSKPTPVQLRLLRRFQQGVILAPDNDRVGNALLSTATPYLQRFIPVYHAEPVDLGPKADLGDYIKTRDPGGALREHLTHRVRQIGVEV